MQAIYEYTQDDYVYEQHNYVYMQDDYVYKQHNYVNMQEYHVHMQDSYVYMHNRKWFTKTAGAMHFFKSSCHQLGSDHYRDRQTPIVED